MLENEVVGRECRFSFWLPKIVDEDRPERERSDTHVIVEIEHYKDGTRKKKLRILENYERPFWITKPHKQNYKEKKETELLDNVNKFTSTQSDLGRNVAIRLGNRYIGKTSIRDVRDSPYIYGLDIDSRVFIKHHYMTKYPNTLSDYNLGVLDIEADVEKDLLTIISLTTRDRIITVLTEDFAKNIKDPERQIKYLFDKYIPKTDITKNIKMEVHIVKTELDAIKKVISRAHEWQPDFIAIWNIAYDMNYMLDICKKYEVDPKDIFSDPSLPKNLRSFEFKMGSVSQTTEAGVNKLKGFEEQWHVVKCPASFYWIDAASAHRYIRVGGKSIPGGYSLSNILTKELGKEFDKLKFPTDTGMMLDSIDWHRYMTKNKPMEYVVYNQWDVISMIHLDDKTKDLKSTIGILIKVSNFDIFDSGPKKLVDSLHFYCLEHGQVIGSKPNVANKDKIMGLDNWIVLLPSSRVKENGLKVIKDNPDLVTNIRTHTYDADQAAGYPSNTIVANVSKETTLKQIISIEGIDKNTLKLQNINSMFGKVNAIEYCTNMYKFPSAMEVVEKIKKERDNDIMAA